MKNLWNKKFEASNVVKPKEILDEQGKTLLELTGGKILARAEEYDGPTRSYKSAGLMAGISVLGEKEYNVQDDLGEIDGSKFTYEFYITSIATPNFKYRVMFVEHDITFYPLTITLDESIAKELVCKQYISCDSEDEFLESLSGILNSDKIESVINALLSIKTEE